MKIALDLDGVVYEFQRTYRYMMREYRGLDIPPIEEFWHSWDGADQYTEQADRDWLWSEGVKLGLFRYGHMTKGSRVALQKIVEAGHEIEIVTSRPSSAVNDTLDWISLFFKDIPLVGLHFLSNGESKWGASNAHVLIDDRKENLEAWAVYGHRHAIVFDRPWNQDLYTGSKIIRAASWSAVPGIIQSIVEG